MAMLHKLASDNIAEKINQRVSEWIDAGCTTNLLQDCRFPNNNRALLRVYSFEIGDHCIWLYKGPMNYEVWLDGEYFTWYQLSQNNRLLDVGSEIEYELEEA